MANKAKPTNEMKLVFPTLSANESFARTAVSSFVGLMDPKMDELIDIKTAVSEAVTNCIVHAYRDSAGNIELTARIYPDRTVYIRIKDLGCGIEEIGQAMEPLYTTRPEEESSGLGYAV